MFEKVQIKEILLSYMAYKYGYEQERYLVFVDNQVERGCILIKKDFRRQINKYVNRKKQQKNKDTYRCCLSFAFSVVRI